MCVSVRFKILSKKERKRKRYIRKKIAVSNEDKRSKRTCNNKFSNIDLNNNGVHSISGSVWL